MASFTQFIQSIRNDGNDGKAFEIFSKWFLTHDPEWSTQVDEVWLWHEWPDKWGPDCGIDLIFKHKNCETWAVQAKCYDAGYPVTKKDMDTFLSETSRAAINKRLLLTTTDLMSANAIRTCDHQEKDVVRFMLHNFEEAAVNYPAHVSELNKVKPKERPTPRPHQKDAIDATALGLETHDRGQLIMACGTGKTFTTLWVKERLNAGNTLVLLPSLNLLGQTMREWTAAWNEPFDVLCVCSDKSVGRKNEDMGVSEAPFPVRSQTNEIESFLQGNGPKVVFCTYQSSDLIAEVQKNRAVPAFDLVVADEAHRCAGKADASFSRVLDGDAIRASKRLFTTATPRIYAASLSKKAEERGVEIIGMDDVAKFGPQLHTLTFGQAIHNKPPLLTDYQVVIVGVDEPMVKQWIDEGEIIALNPDDATDARSLAAKIGLIKAIKDYDLKRVISFHSRVNGARDFSVELSDIVGLVDESQRPEGSIWSDFVSGKMSAGERTTKINKLKNLGSADRGLLTNARCLSEGVDVPALDGVAFIDPRGSQVDIIQAVGRAIRKSEDKEKGTIVIPVFIEDGDDVEASIEASNFKPVWDVVKALRSHDEVLADELDQYRTDMGRKSVSKAECTPDKIVFNLPQSVDVSFSDALQTVLVESTTSSWNFWYGLLREFVEREGHARPAVSFKTENGINLGQWVRKQRPKESSLTRRQRQKLDQLQGWSWDPREAEWLDAYDELKAYINVFGHALVPSTYTAKSGFKLGSWVNSQRTYYNNGKLSNTRIEILESSPEWIWNVLDFRFRQGLEALKCFVEENGHAMVPLGYSTANGFGLGNWVSSQRSRKAKLSTSEISELQSISGWTWNAFDTRWQEGLLQLRKFIGEHHHSRVPRDFVTYDGYSLGNWCKHQRAKREKLSKEKQEMLASLPAWEWTWDKYEAIWQDRFKHLMEYYEAHKTAKVPYGYVTASGFKLSNWVITQRSYEKAGKLPEHQKHSLEQLKGWEWSKR